MIRNGITWVFFVLWVIGLAPAYYLLYLVTLTTSVGLADSMHVWMYFNANAIFFTIVIALIGIPFVSVLWTQNRVWLWFALLPLLPILSLVTFGIVNRL